MMIAVRDAAHLAPCLAAVNGLEERRAALVSDLRVGRVDAHLAVVHPAIALIREKAPRLAGVVRSPDAALPGIGRRRLLSASAARPAAALPGLHQRPILVDAGAGSTARSYFDRRIDRRRFRTGDVQADPADDRVIGQA